MYYRSWTSFWLMKNQIVYLLTHEAQQLLLETYHISLSKKCIKWQHQQKSMNIMKYFIVITSIRRPFQPDYLNPYTLRPVYVFSILLFIHFFRCWWGEFQCSTIKISSIGDYFLHSHDLNVWFKGDIIRRNYILVTLRGSRVNCASASLL